MYLFAANDPGPINYINQLLPYIDNDYRIVVNASHTKILKNQFREFVITFDQINSYEFSLCICGTSLNENFETLIISDQLSKGVKTISFIDHWSNMKERFKFKNSFLYADYIFVNDSRAKKIAMDAEIPADRIFVIGNPIIEDLITNDQITVPKNNKILFISEDISSTLEVLNSYDEYMVMDALSHAISFGYEIDIKLHPAESNNQKYSNYKIKNVFTNKDFNVFANYEYIVGMNSFLLLELSMLRQNVLSFTMGFKNDIAQSGFVHTVNSKNELNNIFLKHEIINSSDKNLINQYICSSERIIKFLQSI